MPVPEAGWTDEEIANAIFQAEGGDKAQYLYGIRSVKYKDAEDARRIALNTITNNRRRYEDYGKSIYPSYLEFLASRYAPIGVGNDPQNLNRNWLSNVQFYLRRGRPQKSS